MRCRVMALSLVLVVGVAAALRSQAPPQPSVVFASPFSPLLTGMYDGSPIAVDGEGNSYVAGSALFSGGFPITVDAAQRNATQMFVTKLDRVDGRIVWGTYLGGVRPTGMVNITRTFINVPTAIQVDAGGNVWVAGWTATSDFPMVNPVVSGPQGTAFVAKLNPRGSAILFSTYLGASPPFVGNIREVALAVDAIGNAYVGLSNAQLRVAYETRDLSSVGNSGNLLVAKFNPAGGVVYATRFGSGGSDVIQDLAVDSTGAVHVIGAAALPSFPTLNAIVPQCPRVQNLQCNAPFVAKLDSTGSRLVYSTFLSGSTGNTTATSVTTDFAGATYVTGTTTSTDFPVRQAHQTAYGGMGDGFLTKLGPTGSLVTSTYLGGGAAETSQHRTVLVDPASRPIVIGFTRSADVPALPGVEHPDAPLYQSRDGGVTWRPLTNGLVRNGVLPELHALAATHTGQRVWYAGATDGVYVSIDTGASWQFSNEGLGANRLVCAIATDPAHPDTVYAGTPSGTYKSDDRGQRWTQVYPGEFNCSVFFRPSSGLVVDGSGVVFATRGSGGSTGSGIVRSSDGGRTWLDVSSGLADGAVRSIVFDPTVPGVVYAVGSPGLYRSTNGGSSWTRVTGLPANTNLDSFAIAPGPPSRIYGQASRLLRSDDEGRTWTEWSGFGGRYITLQPGQRDVLFGHHRDSRLTVSVDAGESWTMVSNGLPDRVTAFAFDPRDANLAFAAASTRALPLLLAFDQEATRVRVAGFLDPWPALRVAHDPSGDLYISTTVNSQPTVVKLRMP